jgi:hypothetical protein
MVLLTILLINIFANLFFYLTETLHALQVIAEFCLTSNHPFCMVVKGEIIGKRTGKK